MWPAGHTERYFCRRQKYPKPRGKAQANCQDLCTRHGATTSGGQLGGLYEAAVEQSARCRHVTAAERQGQIAMRPLRPLGRKNVRNKGVITQSHPV